MARHWRCVDFGHAYEVAGRSLLLFVLQPERTPQRATAAERSFQRVVQAVEEAATEIGAVRVRLRVTYGMAASPGARRGNSGQLR